MVFVLIDKPGGCTSHDVRELLAQAGGHEARGASRHARSDGDLGLLVVMTGRATRLAQYLGDGDKTYLAEITFGAVSDTYDSEGLITETGVRAPSDIAKSTALWSDSGGDSSKHRQRSPQKR